MRVFAILLSVILGITSFANDGITVIASQSADSIQIVDERDTEDIENVYHTIIGGPKDYYSEDGRIKMQFVPREEIQFEKPQGEFLEQELPSFLATEYDFLNDCSTDYGFRKFENYDNPIPYKVFYVRILEVFSAAYENGKNIELTDFGGTGYYCMGSAEYATLGLTDEEVFCVYLSVLYDHPLIYFAENTILYDGQNVYLMIQEDFANGEVRRELAQSIEQAIEEIAAIVPEGSSNYEIAKLVHDKIIEEVDYAFEPDGVTPKNNGYVHSIAGYVSEEKEVVCDGYASTFGAVLNYLDIENIFVNGWGVMTGCETSDETAHAWNIVQLGNGQYYFVDVTWDDRGEEGVADDYLCLGMELYNDHSIFQTGSSANTYYMYELPQIAETAFVGEDTLKMVADPEYKLPEKVDSSEQCGDYVGWTLDDEGVMTIWGTGPMWDFANDADFYDYHGECPWKAERTKIKKVVIESGVTTVGALAFEGCVNMKKVTFSDTLKFIGNFAFLYCTKLQNFTLPDSLQGIGQEAFMGCEKITKVVIPDKVTFLDASIFNGAIALTEVYIGGSLEVPGYVYSNSIFANCTALEEINVSVDNIALMDIDGMLYGKSDHCLVQYPLGKKDKKVILPDLTAGIVQFAIVNALYLEELVLPEGLQGIGSMAIAACPCLKYLTIPSSVLGIEDSNGQYCPQLVYIENKSDVQMSLTGESGIVWINAKGKTMTSLGKGKAYQHGAASGVVLSVKDVLRVGDSDSIPTRILYNGSGWIIEDKKDLIFTSSNPKVATVSEEGEVVAKSAGKTKITIKNRYTNAEKTNDFVSTYTVNVVDNIKISNAKITSVASQYYTGKAIKPTITVKYNGKTLKKDKDYTLSYQNNKNIGKGTVFVKGKGSYTGTVKKTFTIGVKKGSIYTVDNVKYKITNAKTDGKGTVTVIGAANGSKLTKLSIGNTVKIGGKNFQITAIGAQAFKNCKKLKTAVIGTNVKTIGKEAFAGDKLLSKITIKSKNLTSIGKSALKDIKADAVIDVPSSKVKAYQKLLKSSVGYKETMKVK